MHLPTRARFRPPTHCLINSIPDELLNIIFVFSVPPALADPTPGSGAQFIEYMVRAYVRDYPTLLGCVCRRWRGVAHASQELNAFVFVDIDAFEGSDMKKRNARTYYAELLSRSGARPLTLSVDASAYKCMEPLIQAPFAAHLGRLQHVCINAGDTTSREPLLPLFSDVETPLLETVYISLGEDNNSNVAKTAHAYFRELFRQQQVQGSTTNDILLHAPRLTSFSMDEFEESFIAPQLSLMVPQFLRMAGLRISSLTCLRLPEVPYRVLDLYKIIPEISDLRVLRCALHVVEAKEDEDQAKKRIDGESEEEREGRYRALYGPHTLPNLVDLHVLAVNTVEGYDKPAIQSGPGRFMAGLILPALSAFGATQVAVFINEDDMQVGRRGKALALAKVLPPILQSLKERSGCEIHHLQLDVPKMTRKEMNKILQILAALRTLRFDMTMTIVRRNILEDLGKRNAKGHLSLVPLLHALFIDNHDPHTGYTAEAILDLVEARWPEGWSEWATARVHIVRLLTPTCETYGLKEGAKTRLGKLEARGDVELIIEDRDMRLYEHETSGSSDAD